MPITLVRRGIGREEQVSDQIERLTWSLWHRQVDKVLAKINDLQTSVAQFIRVCRWFKLVYM